MAVVKRAYLNIEDISREYLPMSRKKIRQIVTKNLPHRKIGGRIYVARDDIEKWLNDNN